MANLKLSYENQIQKNLVIATQNGNTKNKENSRKKIGWWEKIEQNKRIREIRMSNSIFEIKYYFYDPWKHLIIKIKISTTDTALRRH